jgi:hypothetical protein
MVLLLALMIAGAGCKTLVSTENYETRTIGGFSVHVNRALGQEPLGARAIALLEARLLEIGVMVEEPALSRLREVPIWIGVEDGTHPQPEYHKSESWLREHGCNPDKARAVEIGSAAYFVKVRRSQPGALLHELAHAFHDRVLGKDERITRLYAEALASRRYDSVLRNDGTRGRHYALANEGEYFAEGTEAFYGENDYYPFVRAELRTHDPKLHALLEDVWGRAEPASCKMRVLNQTDRSIAIYWRDASGALKPYGTIAKGGTKTMETFVGHQWVAQQSEATISEYTASGDSVWRVTRTSSASR